MSELKPAHEVIVDSIKTHCNNMQAVQRAMAGGGVKSGGRFIPAAELETGRLQEVGGLCSQLKALQAMIIPDEALPWVIQELRQLDCRHATIDHTVDVLNERQQAGGGLDEHSAGHSANFAGRATILRGDADR